ncbi:MAG: C-GCAxxG-C-C family (seleno)protein [Ethanoligenens sp.]
MQNKKQLVDEASDYYLGQNGREKSNCAQAVANTFVKELHLQGIDLDVFRNYGGGRAPGGECGALYAAKAVLEESGLSEKAGELESIFQKQAGALTCREIRSARKLPCAGCVEKAATFLCDCIKE